MAYALNEFGNVTLSPEMIYSELLECEFEKWVAPLESIIDSVESAILKAWSKKKSATFKKGMWAKGDEVLLTERAWKLKTITKPKTKKVKKPEVKMRRQTTIFDFMGG